MARVDFLRALGEAGIAPSPAPAAGYFPCGEVAAKDFLKGWRNGAREGDVLEG